MVSKIGINGVIVEEIEDFEFILKVEFFLAFLSVFWLYLFFF